MKTVIFYLALFNASKLMDAMSIYPNVQQLK